MKRLVVTLTVVVLAVALQSSPVRAQFTVFDPSVYAQAIAQVEQLIRQYEFLIQQTQRVSGMYGRYHVYTPDWPFYDRGSVFYAGGFLGALNQQVTPESGYRSMADALDSYPDVAWRMPEALRDPLATQYANVELADQVALMSIGQVGTMRETANMVRLIVQDLERDSYADNDDLQTQTAVLNKINASGVLGIRVALQSHELLGDTLEQLIVDNKRKRDAEARAMNATIYQWRYGPAYGADMFQNTAAHVNNWRPF